MGLRACDWHGACLEFRLPALWVFCMDSMGLFQDPNEWRAQKQLSQQVCPGVCHVGMDVLVVCSRAVQSVTHSGLLFLVHLFWPFGALLWCCCPLKSQYPQGSELVSTGPSLC